jgi:hypothetical protein
MHFEYMRKQDRSDIKVIQVPENLRPLVSFSRHISNSPDINTTIKASTLAELVIAGKIGAQHVTSAIHNGTVEAKRFKAVFWKEIRGINVDRLPQAALKAIGVLTPILM